MGRWGQVSGEGGLGMDNDRGVRGWSASPGNLLEVRFELWPRGGWCSREERELVKNKPYRLIAKEVLISVWMLDMHN